MSKITSPILLDSTGQDIRGTLVGIQEALLAQNAFIDDNTTAADRVWSSKKIMESLTSIETSTGSSIIFSPVAATPITVETDVMAPGTLVLTHTNGTNSIEYECYIPAAGHFNWCTGELAVADGNTAKLAGHSIKAMKGTNTLAINVGTISASYRVVGVGSGGTAPSWDVIHGGSAAAEEV